MQQVITIAPDGVVSGLQHKPGKGLDLRTLGHAQIVRASEIVWSEHRQGWYVLPLQGRYAQRELSVGMWTAYVDQAAFPEGGIPAGDAVIYFQDYDLAVKAEIRFLDALRLRGIF